jgi:hypothetical protein
MEYKDFLQLLMPYQKMQSDFDELHSMGFDFLEGKYRLEENAGRIISAALDSLFTEEGVDWINWFMYENDWGQKDWSRIPKIDKDGKIVERDPVEAYGAKDENGKPICYSFESTWEYVKQYLKNGKED